jgi:hypothetical protein
MPKIKAVNFDMDGVMTNFIPSVKKITGKTVDEIEAMPEEEKYRYLSDFKKNGFFKKMIPMPYLNALVELMKVLRENGIEVNVLSSAGNEHFDKCRADKMAWLRSHVNFKFDNVRIVPKSPDKAKYAGAGIILIDDREKALKPFKAAGGIAVHHTAPHKTLVEVMKLVNKGK